MKCIDLKQRFGDRFRVSAEESYQAESGSSTNNNRDPWLWIIRGSRGHIYPHGGEYLAIALNAGARVIANRLRAAEWCEVTQDGDEGEVNAKFHVDDIDKAVEVIKAYRRPQFSEETLQRKREQIANVRKGLIDGRSEALGRTQAGSGDTDVAQTANRPSGTPAP